MNNCLVVFLLLLSCGLGSAWPVNQLKAQSSEITGQISTSDGTPLVGARIDIATAAPKVGRGLFCPSCYLDCRKSTTTDEEGEFHLKSLSEQLKFRLVISAPGYKTLQSKLLDPTAGPVNLILRDSPKDVDASRVVSGVIKDNLGNPLAGALIEPYGAKTAKRRWWGSVKDVDAAVSDSQGKFAILLPESMLALDINITQHGFCGERIMLMEPGTETSEIEMRVGARVVGRLVENGNPVAGMSVAVVQLERGGTDSIFVKAVGCVSDQDGRFEFCNLPPDERYCIYSVVGEANRSLSKPAKDSDASRILTVKKFSVPGTGAVRDLGNLVVAESVSISGQIKHVDGKPLPKNLKLSFGRDPAWDLIAIPVASDGSFSIDGLPPETYELDLRSQDLVIVAKDINRHLLSTTSIGIYADESITDLIIPVRGK